MKETVITVYPKQDNSASWQKEDDSKRSPIEINASILELCAGGGMLKTHILYKANLSYTMLTSYLAKLLKCRLLEVDTDDSKYVFKITEKGREYLYHYLLMQKLAMAE